MSARIVTEENHVKGKFTVDAYVGTRKEPFSSVEDAKKWLRLMKLSGCIDELIVTCIDRFVSAKKWMTYESYFVM